ncbi:MAG: hypothetical protein ABI543_00465 [Ignavibacteria bacterium]
MDTGNIILILSFGVPILVIAAIFWWMKRDFSRLSKWAKENKERQAFAKPAKAKIISVSQGIQGGDIKKMIFFTFEINDGFTSPYTASAGWFVDTLHLNKIQEGMELDVKVDSEDPQKIYPANSWATYTEGYSSDLNVEKLRGR